MNVAAKLAAFAVVLAALFGGGAAAGGIIDPGTPVEKAEPAPMAREMEMPAGDSGKAAHGGSAAAGHGVSKPAVRGLAVAENGMRLVVEDAELRRGATEQLRFRIVDDRGRAVRDFEVEHTKKMHLIVAERDLSGFQHLHPTMGRNGTWTTPLRLGDAGSYRLFADFSRNGTPTTLATDLRVDGTVDLQPLPAQRAVARSDGGYDVRLERGVAHPGQESELRFLITKGGHTVHVEPYLGADGHLVALREGDLAFLHVHPADHGHGAKAANGGHDDSIAFEATFPTAGAYRLFLQFQHEGTVETVAFTQEVR